MAGFRITTDMGARKALATAADVAEELGYRVEELDKWSFVAKRGSLAASICLGAFSVYCEFEVEVEEGRYEGEVEILIHRNSAWWTGVIGVNRVKNAAKELADEIADTIEDLKARVIKVREF